MASKVFVSSLMRGMENQRRAARLAIESLELQPVMAEDFTSSPATPQGACLQAVGQADIVVLLIGKEYGAIQPSGKSATEEEFDEAKRLAKPILVFIVSEQHDDDEYAFLSRISTWHDGSLFGKCTSNDQLQKSIVRALRNLTSGPSNTQLSSIVTQGLSRVRPEVHHGTIPGAGPWLSFSWAPSGVGLGFDEHSFFHDLPDLVGDLLVSGKHRLLEARPQTRALSDGLAIESNNGFGSYPNLLAWIAATGPIAIGASFQRSTRNASSFEEFHFARPSDACKKLDSFFSFFEHLLNHLDTAKTLQSGLAQASLSHLGMANFSEPARNRSGGVSVSLTSRDEPILAPEKPEVVSRFDLTAGNKRVATYIQRFERRINQENP